MKLAIVGSGFSGAVLAHELAENLDCKIILFDERPHVGGNCYTERDRETGIMIHRYGPHIFHTSNLRVWNFVNKFANFRPFVNRVKAVTPDGLYSLPINLMTINQFFKKTFSPKEARVFLEGLGDKNITEAQNLEEQALKLIGRDLYENFFKGYTIKQWGVDPTKLPAAILKRLPVRFNYDDNYYSSIYQGIPEEGYTPIFENLLASPKIQVKLNTRFDRSMISEFDHLFFTGPIDQFFDNNNGSLGYRTVFFEKNTDEGDFQGTHVLNYTSISTPYTRVAEYKHLTPWEAHKKTIYIREFSKNTESHDIPYYPMRREEDIHKLEKYFALAKMETKVSFLGRLATYRYLDMHAVIDEALDFSEKSILALSQKHPLPIFLDTLSV